MSEDRIAMRLTTAVRAGLLAGVRAAACDTGRGVDLAAPRGTPAAGAQLGRV